MVKMKKGSREELYSEYNVSYLGLISIQKRLPESFKQSWETQEGTERIGNGIKCTAAIDGVVPHGLSNDVFSVIVTNKIAVQAAQFSAEQIHNVTLTVGEIVRQLGLPGGATTHEAVRRCLIDLANARYFIWHAWQSPTKGTSEKVRLSLISALHEKEEENFDKNKKTIEYVISLSPHINESLEGSLVMMNNQVLMQALASPTARGLYRVLEALRRDITNITYAQSRITISLVTLINSCRLLSDNPEPARMLRQLMKDGAAFSQLIEVGYITRINTVGTGWNTILEIDFQQEGNLKNMTAMKLLIEHGIAAKQADELAAKISTEEAEAAIWDTENRVKAAEKSPKPIHSPAAITVQTLCSAGLPTVVDLYRNRKVSRAVSQPVARPSKVTEEEIPEKELTPEENIQLAHKSIKALRAIGKLDATEANNLHNLIDEGKLQSEDIRKTFMMTKEEIKNQLQEWFNLISK